MTAFFMFFNLMIAFEKYFIYKAAIKNYSQIKL